MASQYAHTINEKRYNLIDQLVVKLLQVEVSRLKGVVLILPVTYSRLVPLHHHTHSCSNVTVAAVVLQGGHENFELARDFCVQKAWFNSFPDVNPRKTEEFYAGYVVGLWQPCGPPLMMVHSHEQMMYVVNARHQAALYVHSRKDERQHPRLLFEYLIF